MRRIAHGLSATVLLAFAGAVWSGPASAQVLDPFEDDVNAAIADGVDYFRNQGTLAGTGSSVGLALLTFLEQGDVDQDGGYVDLSPADQALAVQAANTLANNGSYAGRGGMQSKVWACRIAQRSGCEAVIASGRVPGALERALAGDRAEGTWFPAAPGLDAKRRWVAFASEAKGTLHLDPGAVSAVRERGASLLAAGVTRIEGTFAKGEVVELCGPEGVPIGRGIVHCSAAEARAWQAGQAPAGAKPHHALVHRDQLALD